MNRAELKRSRGGYILPALLALVVLVPAGHAEAEDGRCVRAELPRSVVLPDGKIHSPGLLRICLTRNYSPVAGLHETYVNGTFAGMFLSRRGKSEGPVEQNESFLLFHRNAADQWELHGYTLPDGEGLMTYRLDTIGRQSPPEWIADHGPPPAAPESGWVVLLAADGR